MLLGLSSADGGMTVGLSSLDGRRPSMIPAPGFYPRFPRGVLFRSSHISDLKIGTSVATLPCAWRNKVSVGRGWPGVYCDWLRQQVWSVTSVSV